LSHISPCDSMSQSKSLQRQSKKKLVRHHENNFSSSLNFANAARLAAFVLHHTLYSSVVFLSKSRTGFDLLNLHLCNLILSSKLLCCCPLNRRHLIFTSRHFVRQVSPLLHL
jgi:hypothetical protein